MSFLKKRYNDSNYNDYKEVENEEEEEYEELEEEEEEESDEYLNNNKYHKNNFRNNKKNRIISNHKKSKDSFHLEDLNDDYEDDYYDNEYEDEYDDDYYFYDNYYESHYYNKKNSIENKFRFDNNDCFTKKVDKTINPNPYLDIDDRKVNVLMIAEKPSIAKAISKILAPRHHYNDRSKENDWCLYEFDGKFKEINAHFTVSSVAGHMYQTEFLRMHQNFDMNPGELFDVPTVKTECDEDSFITSDWLKDLSNGKDILCLWLDCDREGENICYEVIYNTLPYMNPKEYQQVYRAFFSSITEEDITEAFQNMANYPDNNLSLSVDAREVIDLKIGVSLTRFLTKNIFYYLPEDKKKGNFLSYGPCQTPTLWFCVNRQKELEKQNLIYYKIFIELLLKNKNEKYSVKIYLNEDYKNLNEVLYIVESLRRFKRQRKLLEIEKLTSEKREKERPPGLNTANMLKMSSTYLGISPQTTMNIAEKLYTKGYISYPRTETTQYSPNFDFKENLHKFSKDPKYSKVMEELSDNFDAESILNGGSNFGDHPPITPSRANNKGNLQGKELELFELILKYYFASLSPNLEYENLTYEFEIEGKKYKSTCSVIKNDKMGFLKFLPFQKKEFIDKDYILDENEKYEIKDINYEQRKIDSYITEAELIEEMEKNHIGTDASMSVHIANIVRRGYVRVDDKRRLIPTQLGKALIEALESVEPDIVRPKNRAKIEEFVSLLAEGGKTYKEVLDYALDFYKKKYYSLSSQIDKLNEVFGKYFHLEKY